MARMLSHADLHDRGIKYSRQHLYRLINRELFPRPVKLGAGSNAWLESEIDEYLRDRVAERDRKRAPRPSRAESAAPAPP
jgi:prophage regulatory protein